MERIKQQLAHYIAYFGSEDIPKNGAPRGHSVTRQLDGGRSS
jgi:hypothetical protein